MVSLRTKFWLTHDNRDRRNAGTSFRTKGSIPILQASANRTAQMLTARSPALESRSLIWVNFAVKSVRAAISSRISGKSTRGSRAAISLRSRTRLGYIGYPILPSSALRPLGTYLPCSRPISVAKSSPARSAPVWPPVIIFSKHLQQLIASAPQIRTAHG